MFYDPPIHIVGVDGNVHMKAAYVGEYWTPTGYRAADHLLIRETVQRGLEQTKQFWQAKGLWPETTPVEEHLPSVTLLKKSI